MQTRPFARRPGRPWKPLIRWRPGRRDLRIRTSNAPPSECWLAGASLPRRLDLARAAQWHKADRQQVLRLPLALRPLSDHAERLLPGGISHRDDHGAARLELLEQRLRHMLGPGGDHDSIKGRRLWPA